MKFMRKLASFFSFLGKFLKSFIFGIGILATLIILVMFTNVKKMSKPFAESYGPEDKLVVHWKLEGTLSEREPSKNVLGSLMGSSINKKDIYLPHWHHTLTKMASDPQVKRVFLEIGDLDGSFAQIYELHSYLKAIKNAGKELVVWAPYLTNKTYYLASLAKQIFLAPNGDVKVPGPHFELMYFGDALRKLGIGIEVVRSGAFKSLFEPFISNTPSKESRLMYGAIEKNLRQHMVRQIAEAREKSVNDVDLWLKHSFFSGQTALLNKLIDGLSYLDDAKKAFSEKGTLVGLDAYAYQNQDTFSAEGDGIAFIEATGEMFLNSPPWDKQKMNREQLSKELSWAVDDDQVKAIVLRIDSPGGSSLAADLMWDDVRKAVEKKPVVVSMGGVAASGGYYIAAPATKIFASPTTLTGSIGVIGMLPYLKEGEDKYGISFHVISESERKRMLNPGTRSSKSDQKILLQQVTTEYKTFVRKVALGRKKDINTIDKVAQGRVWTGDQAKRIGLVDDIGTLFDAMKEAKKLAGLSEEREYPVYRYHPEFQDIRECISENGILPCLSMESSLTSSIESKSGLLSFIESVKTLFTRTKTYAWVPFHSNALN